MNQNSSYLKIKNFIFLHIVILLYSLCSVISKFASQQKFFSISFIMLYGTVLFIMFVYAVLWQQVLKKMDLTIAFVNKSITVIWGMFWGLLLFDEKITFYNIIGAVVVLFGVCLVVKSDE